MQKNMQLHILSGLFFFAMHHTLVRGTDNDTCVPMSMHLESYRLVSNHCEYTYVNENCTIVFENPCTIDIRVKHTFFFVPSTCNLCPQDANKHSFDLSTTAIFAYVLMISVVAVLLINVCGMRVSVRNNNTLITLPQITMFMVVHDHRKIQEMIVSIDDQYNEGQDYEGQDYEGQETDKCAICLDDIQEPCRFNSEKFPHACACTSMYCKECLIRWLTISRKCPICRIGV